MQLEGEGIEPRRQHPVAARQGVVGHHRRDGDGQAEGGHDQRLADRAGDLVERAGAAAADRQQRVIDAPDGAEQADEGRGGADRGEQRQAVVEARAFLVEHLLDRARQELGRAAGLGEPRSTVLRMMRLRMQRLAREMRERLGSAVLAQAGRHLVERGGVPEAVEKTPAAAPLHQPRQALGADQQPRQRRHGEQQHQQRAADGVGLRQEMAEAERLRGRGGGIDGIHHFSSSNSIGAGAHTASALPSSV